MKEILKKNKKYVILLVIFISLVSLLGCAGITPDPPVIHSFSANPPIINEGESSTLSWSATDAETITIDQSVGIVTSMESTAVSPIVSTTYNLTATNSAGSVTAATTITVNPMATLTISQTEGTARSSFGANPVYVNVGQGQSFQITEAGFFDQFQIYLSSTMSSTNATDSGDIIVCDLRNSSGNVLQTTSINGFAPGNEGWQIFDFNSVTYILPGTYYCTCYVSNPLEDHAYSCHGNADSNSYPDGARYSSTGGNPEDWSSWFTVAPDWDLLFKVILNVSP